jgi:catechol 2,3-dioxygenase-like lactoylglutathione lyase family enzyme
MRPHVETLSLKGVGAVTLFVEDLPPSKLFQNDVFGLRVLYQDEDSAVFAFGNTIVNLLGIPAARELVEQERSPVARRIALPIDRLGRRRADAACAELEARGATLLTAPDELGVGEAHCRLHRSRRQHLGDRAGAGPRGSGSFFLMRARGCAVPRTSTRSTSRGASPASPGAWR